MWKNGPIVNQFDSKSTIAKQTFSENMRDIVVSTASADDLMLAIQKQS